MSHLTFIESLSQQSIMIPLQLEFIGISDDVSEILEEKQSFQTHPYPESCKSSLSNLEQVNNRHRTSSSISDYPRLFCLFGVLLGLLGCFRSAQCPSSTFPKLELLLVDNVRAPASFLNGILRRFCLSFVLSSIRSTTSSIRDFGARSIILLLCPDQDGDYRFAWFITFR